jgi:hypothetical protein
MATRRIICSGCNTFLGEIWDAKLKKNMVHLCEVCEKKRVAANNYIRTVGRKNTNSPVSDLMDGLFGGRRF